MPSDDLEKLNRVEELKSKLSSKSYRVKLEHRDSLSHQDGREVPDAWQDRQKEEGYPTSKFFMKTSIFKKFFFFSLIFFVLTLGYAGYVFLAGGNTVSNNNIDISVLSNAFIAGGEELPMIISIANRNNVALDLVDLVIKYPKSVSVSGPDPFLGNEHLRISLGTIPAGTIRNENLKVVFFGEQGGIVPIKMSIEYRVEGSNAIFVKEKDYEVTINSTPLNLSIDGPSHISPNQDITLHIKATLNATRPAQKMLLRVEYPPGFQFISSVPESSINDNVWSLGDLPPGAERQIAVTGRMIDVFDGDEKTFRVASGTQSSSDKSVIESVFNSISHFVIIRKPFIETKFFVNGIYERGYAVSTNSTINGDINWVNNLDTRVSDLEISAKITGNAVDRKTIRAQQGFYNSSEDTIVWDKNSQSKFREIEPGASGAVSFSLSPLSLFSAGGLLSNPSVNVEISISGKRSLEGYGTEALQNSELSIIKIISDVGFSTKALYFSGPFTNIGPIPPKAEQETTYTVVWTLSNTSNSISKTVVRSSLPSWVRFVGPVSPSGEDLTYNASSRELVWNVGKIPKGASIIAPEKSVSFQVGFTPSISQIGAVPVLVNDAILTGHDDFANVDVKVNKTSLRTIIDSSATSGVVVE